MPQTFVFNMGYDTSHVNSVLASEGVSSGSNVILVVLGEADSRQENSIDEIQSYLGSLDIDVSLEVFPLAGDIGKDMSALVELFSERQDICLSLSGGPRDTLIPLTLAATFSDNRISKTYFRSDIDAELDEIDLPYFSPDISETELSLIRECAENRKTAREITDNTVFSDSTVYRVLDDLADRNLIQITKDEGKKNYGLTSLGKLIISREG